MASVWDDAEGERGEKRDGDGKGENARVRGKIHPEGKIDGDKRKQSGDARIGEKDSERAAGQAEEKTLGDELAEETAARGAERGANRDFADTGGSFDEEEVADIGAGDEEKQGDGDEESDDRFAIGARNKIADGNSARFPIVIDRRIFAVDLLEERFKFASGLLDGNARLETGDGAEEVVRAASFGGVPLERDPELGAIGEVEAGGHDADDGGAILVDLNGFAEDVRITAVAALPEFFADDDNLGAVGEVVFAGNRAAEKWIEAKHAEYAVAHPCPWDALGGALPSNRPLDGIVDADVIENPSAGADIEIIGERDLRGFVGICGTGFGDGDEAFRLRIGKRAKEEAVGEAEDEGGGSDAESENEDRGGGDGEIFTKDANGVTEIVKDHVVVLPWRLIEDSGDGVKPDG